MEVCSESAGFSATGTDRTPTCAGHPNLLSGISLNELLILEKPTVTPHLEFLRVQPRVPTLATPAKSLTLETSLDNQTEHFCQELTRKEHGELPNPFLSGAG